MSRRALALAALVTTSLLTACAEHVTAPVPSTLAPADPRRDAFDPTVCKQGYIMSEGRCI